MHGCEEVRVCGIVIEKERINMPLINIEIPTSELM